MLIMDKIIEAAVPHSRSETLSSPSVLANLKNEMLETAQEQVDSINSDLDLHSDLEQFHDFINEHKAEIKWNANTNKIKNVIVVPMNSNWTSP